MECGARFRLLVALVLWVGCGRAGVAQAIPQPTEDPMRIGEQALAKNDFAGALDFFTAYLKENPDSLNAQFFAGSAELGLKNYDEAARYFQGVIAKSPAMWPAHKNLVIVYAAQGKWGDFDLERALIQKGREQGSPGLSAKDADVIDLLHVGEEMYVVRAYAELSGRFKTRYNFTHFNKDGKVDFWISCESDDVDQSFFAQKHPKEAVAGQRSFSLDSYSQMLNASGQLTGQTHGTIKFYPDGEPTYETVRADAIGVLQHKVGPISTTTSPVQGAGQGAPKP